MNKDLKIGDEVYLSSSHNMKFGVVNPLTCSGTIKEVEGNLGVVITWGNGQFNFYRKENPNLIPKIQPSREAARIAARRNPNLTVIRENGKWVLKLKDKLVINDGGK